MSLKYVIHFPETNSVEAAWTDPYKCHSYADVQMDMLRADLGEDAEKFADLIATVEASIKPPAPEPVVNVSSVTMAQARKALILAGVDLAGISAIFANMPQPQGALAAVDWEFAPTVHIDNPLVQAVSVSRGWTVEQLQAMFNQAATL